jgi:hypothetical protein
MARRRGLSSRRSSRTIPIALTLTLTLTPTLPYPYPYPYPCPYPYPTPNQVQLEKIEQKRAKIKEEARKAQQVPG